MPPHRNHPGTPTLTRPTDAALRFEPKKSPAHWAIPSTIPVRADHLARFPKRKAAPFDAIPFGPKRKVPKTLLIQPAAAPRTWNPERRKAVAGHSHRSRRVQVEPSVPLDPLSTLAQRIVQRPRVENRARLAGKLVVSRALVISVVSLAWVGVLDNIWNGMFVVQNIWLDDVVMASLIHTGILLTAAFSLFTAFEAFGRALAPEGSSLSVRSSPTLRACLTAAGVGTGIVAGMLAAIWFEAVMMLP